MIKGWKAATLAFVCAVSASGAACAWWNDGFAYRKEISVASAAQAGAPVLLRLDSSNFRFEDADAQGRDLRVVAGDDRTPLAFHIESFDRETGLGYVWVALGEQPGDKLYLYYGADSAEPGPAAAQTYDASYRAVLHFSEAAGPLRDASANNVGLSGEIGRASAALIGRGARFDGAQTLAIAPSAATAIDPAAGFSFEAWIKPATAGANGVLYEARDGANALVIGLANGALYVESNGQRVQANGAVGAEWTHVLVAANGQRVTIYLDGAEAGVLNAGVAALSGAARLGAGFVGDLDELRLSSVARDGAYAQVIVKSEGRGGNLLSYGQDEERSGEGFGYFGVIFANITLDAWIVISILAVMAVLSWVVMYVKGAYVAATIRADTAFMALYRQSHGQIDVGALSPRDRSAIAASALYRLYQTGQIEVEDRRADNGGHLSGEAVESIRSALDAVLVEENQKLDRWMVLLTIAISGGPFIGLLGTVLGVMITFAAIALEGDVNVNAIAPGVAAALLATVAGLAVAIPALFGYNFIATRNGDASAKMQVFADRLITRFAEHHARAARLAAE